MRHTLIALLFCGICQWTNSAVGQKPSRSAVGVGEHRQLFVDDHVIDQMHGLKKVFHQPLRHAGNPIFKADKPWEGRILEMPIVVRDEKQQRFHMYYWAIHEKAIYTCYAKSSDGIRWDKPALGLYAGPDGSKQNNIVLRGEGTQARMRYVALNPDTTDPDRRFISLYIDNVPGLTEFAATSPDGIHWKTIAKIGDLRRITGKAPTANPRYFLIEQQWVPAQPHRYRGIWRTQSDDLKNWSGGRLIVERTPEDGPDLEFYHATSRFLGGQTYHGLHLGYLFLYHTDPNGQVLADGTRMAGTIDTGLMVSRDTIHWQRVSPRQAFFPLGEKGSWDGGMNFMMPEVVTGENLRFYYAGWKLEHSAGAENEGAIGLATLRTDGFTSIEPTAGAGTLTTKRLKVTGNRLFVNADANGGSIRVAVLDAKGKPLPGCDDPDCDSLRRDGMQLAVTWRKRQAIPLPADRVVRLRFHIDGAKLYSFAFANQ